MLHHRRDQILWDSIQAKASDHESIPRLDVLDGFLGACHNLGGKIELGLAFVEEETFL